MRRQRVHLKVANMTKVARNRSGDFEGDGKYAENALYRSNEIDEFGENAQRVNL